MIYDRELCGREPELKEARIIREIKRFQSDVQRKNEGLKRSISANGLKNHTLVNFKKT